MNGITQPIEPKTSLGWFSRLKTNHFHLFNQVATEFSELLNLDSWLINPLFQGVEQLDFMAQEGMQELADKTDHLLELIKKKYQHYEIKEPPFVVVKADNGTYGMNVMMVQEGKELLALNRKQRTRMAVSKGNQKVNRVILQEGVYSFETMPNGAVAEPVVYMIGQFVVGGFIESIKKEEFEII